MNHTIAYRIGDMLNTIRVRAVSACTLQLLLIGLVVSSGTVSAAGYARLGGGADNVSDRSMPLWLKMNKQFQLASNVGRPEVKHWLRWYQQHPVHMSRLQEQASAWIGYVLMEVGERDLPGELALLPAVESAYDPLAYSHGQAAGLWQFIPPTATHLGLTRNWWFDARRDVPQSTQAALKYLEYLYARFDNWLHALAAYNAGEGNVAGAIRRNKKRGLPTDFWSLDLPKETESYVPKLLALAAIVREPLRYRVNLLPMPQGSRFEVVDIGGQIDIAQAAALADLNIDTIRHLNPGLNRWATPPNGPHKLLLPSYSVRQFKRGMRKLVPQRRVTWQRHQVKSGETLGEIAKQYRTSTNLLREVNQITGNTIRAKQRLLVAVGQEKLSHYPAVLPSIGGRKTKVKRYYTVKSGDSMWMIARRHDLHMSEIERWNGISRHKPVQPGQRLVFWMPEGQKAKPAGPTHTVVAGDNLWDLARKHKLGVDKLRLWNSMRRGQVLKLGGILRLSAPLRKVSDMPTRKVSYAVRNGDSLDRVARKFGVSVAQLCDWNDLQPTRYLQPGQRLRVHVPVIEQWQDA